MTTAHESKLFILFPVVAEPAKKYPQTSSMQVKKNGTNGTRPSAINAMSTVWSGSHPI
jgi:hypothetical protein